MIFLKRYIYYREKYNHNHQMSMQITKYSDKIYFYLLIFLSKEKYSPYIIEI